MAGNANSGGHNRKPTQMKVLEGTYRADRANPNEPKPALVKIPPAPTIKLNAHGMAEWKRATVILIESAVLSKGDISALSAMCYEFGEFVQCGIDIEQAKEIDSDLALDEMTIEQRIEVMQIKYLCAKELKKLRKEHLEAYSKLVQQFGLTPASRSKVSAIKQGEKDELADL